MKTNPVVFESSAYYIIFIQERRVLLFFCFLDKDFCFWSHNGFKLLDILSTTHAQYNKWKRE